MAKKHTFLFLKPFTGNKLVEIPTIFQQFTRAPDPTGTQILNTGEVVVKPHPQFVGQCQDKYSVLFVKGARPIALFRLGGAQLFRGDQSQL